jgi:copper(I)-binding protein
MSNPTRRLLLATPLLSLALPAHAHDYRAGDLHIDHPWSRAAGANANSAGYLSIRNHGTQPDQLLSARSPAVRTVELHTQLREGEVMRMRPVADIPLPAGQTVRLRPGGLHLMLIGLTEPLVQGMQVPLTLVFARAGEVQVMLAIEAAGARGAHHH